jgi:hypothetical protein
MRQIKNHPNYLITVEGKVFSLHTMRFLTLYVNNDGYNRIKLDGKFYYVHRLVAQTYLPNPENKLEVNHIDGNKKNNMLCNLDWMTRSENMKHACDNGLIKVSELMRENGRRSTNLIKGKNIYTSKIVLDESTGVFYDCVQDAANTIGKGKRYLYRRLDGQVKNNTKFKYV